MDFSSMIIKNIKHNIKNYTAYLLGNSIIQCILFMFFTLTFSPKFMQAMEIKSLKDSLLSMVVLMIAFSIAFIIYTTISFTKYRGREFGVYFTIGLTSKEIMKILCYENIIISFVSFIFASVTGSIFSKLFHMAIGKILRIDNIVFPLSLKAYGVVLLISFGIFLFTAMYQMIFLKKYSVINILKSKSKKDIGSTSTILGVIGIIIFVGSFILFRMVADGKIKNNQDIFLGISIVCTAASAYLIIGFSMTVVVKIMKKFKNTYNNNILFVNSLSHRFMSYRTVLYVVTLMVAGGMTFISITYSTYKVTGKHIDTIYPYDMSFIVDKPQLKDKNIKDFIAKNLGEVKNCTELEALNIPDIRVDKGECLWHSPHMLVISEDNYKALGHNELNLKRGEILYCHIEKSGSFLEVGFMLDLTNKIMNNDMSLEQYKAQHKTDEYIYVPVDNKRDKITSVVNCFYNENYFTTEAVIVNNEDYRDMKQKLGDAAVIYDVLVNSDNGKGQKFEGFNNKLEAAFGKKASDTLIIKSDKFDSDIRENGFQLFICSFVGMMFLIGSAAVLYFKAITSIDEDRERSRQLLRIGLTNKEINSLLMKELGAIFLVPPVLALICAGYYLSVIYNMVNDGEYMWKNSLFVFGIYCVIQTIFFLLTSRGTVLQNIKNSNI